MFQQEKRFYSKYQYISEYSSAGEQAPTLYGIHSVYVYPDHVLCLKIIKNVACVE